VIRPFNLPVGSGYADHPRIRCQDCGMTDITKNAKEQYIKLSESNILTNNEYIILLNTSA